MEDFSITYKVKVSVLILSLPMLPHRFRRTTSTTANSTIACHNSGQFQAVPYQVQKDCDEKAETSPLGEKLLSFSPEKLSGKNIRTQSRDVFLERHLPLTRRF